MRVASDLPTFQQHLVTVNSLRLYYAEVPGDGPALVLVHGIGMDWRVWQAVSRRLRPHFHLYLVDLRGHGESDKPAHGYTLAHYAADIEDLIELLSLDGCALVGSSLGGMVTAAVEAPADIVGHRVLVDPPLTGGPIRDADMFREILRLKHEPPQELVEFLAAYNPHAGRFYLRIMAEMWHRAADGVIEDMLAQPDDYYAIDQALRANEAPTLLMQADPALGGVLADEGAERALALLPHGHLLRFPGAGHAIHAFKPDDFVTALRDFTRMSH